MSEFGVNIIPTGGNYNPAMTWSTEGQSLPDDLPAAKSTRQQRYDQLVAQGVSSADALETEAAEYRTLNDRGIYRHPGF